MAKKKSTPHKIKEQEEEKDPNKIYFNNLYSKVAFKNDIDLKEYFNLYSNKINESLRDFNNNLIDFASKNNQSIDNQIKEIKKLFKNEKLVFVLGAGVSMGYGLPGWDVLLQKLMVNTIEKESDVSTILSKLFSKIFNPSPLIAGRFLQGHFEENDLKFENKVREILYENFDENYSSELMQEIAKFCIAPGKSPNLNSIITFNFDDILEETLTKSNLDLPFKPIFGDGIEVENGELPIYHVHGYLPKKTKLDDSNQITFGESVYHQQYINIYSWNNIVQINKFREYNCVFIGTSLTDPNTRRLLDIANQQRPSKNGFHYCIKKKYKTEKVSKLLKMILSEEAEIIIQKNENQQNFDETVLNLISIVQRFEENDLNSFGIKTIWVDEYEDIPNILNKIRK